MPILALKITKRFPAISRLKNRPEGALRTLSNRAGLTIMEIMIVLAIMASVVAFGAKRLSGTGTQLRSAMRSMSVISKRLHHMARMNRKTYRLVIQLGEGQENSYWIESSDKPVAILSEEQEEKEAEKSSRTDEKPASQFAMDTTILKGPTSLPNKIFFEDVELASRNAVITSGRAYIHFLPQGYAEEAAIHLGDRKDIKWTLLIHPLTGNGEVVGKYVSVKEGN